VTVNLQFSERLSAACKSFSVAFFKKRPLIQRAERWSPRTAKPLLRRFLLLAFLLRLR
jgi:hypothetical protein